ncbi:MAG: DUF4837 family protein [Bacteroidetes bacterium]|nr:DUF4837 family protein [Bacteroidota bacterium]
MERNNFHHTIKACLHKWTGFFVLSGFLLVFVSCDTTNRQGRTIGGIMPNITGGAGEVLVVMDKFNYDNNAGDLLQDILKEEIPGLPQSEPLFDVIQITAASFDNFYKYHRSIVLTTIESGLEPRIRFRENIWAKPQIMVQMEAPNGRALHDMLEENGERIQNFLVQYDRNRLMKTYQDSKDPAIQAEIGTHHQVRLAIPRGYNMDFSKDEYTSVSIESPDLSQVIQVFDYPASGPEDLNVEALKAKRNEITRAFTQGPREDSYVQLSEMYHPIAFDLKMNDRDVVELRGLWELENGFMGGPFISHSVYDAGRKRIVTVDGYLYHPNKKKRVKLKQLEAIIYSLQIL